MKLLKREAFVVLFFSTLIFHTFADKCTNRGGKCKNPNSCNGTILSGLCPGGNNNKCCIEDDRRCRNKNGKCKNPNICIGTVLDGLCPGGNNNKCWQLKVFLTK